MGMTRCRAIWAADYDPEIAEAENERVFARESIPDDGGPDGASVHSDGFYWSAIFAHGCLLRIPQARRRSKIK
jgi:sugar lactone lactonase YvrE